MKFLAYRITGYRCFARNILAALIYDFDKRLLAGGRKICFVYSYSFPFFSFNSCPVYLGLEMKLHFFGLLMLSLVVKTRLDVVVYLLIGFSVFKIWSHFCRNLWMSQNIGRNLKNRQRVAIDKTLFDQLQKCVRRYLVKWAIFSNFYRYSETLTNFGKNVTKFW